MSTLPNITPELIKKYQEELGLQFSPSSIKRKNISIGKFLAWAKVQGHIEENPLSRISDSRLPAKSAVNTRFKIPATRYQNWYNKYQNIPGVVFLNIAVALLLTSAVGLGIYNQFFRNAKSPLALTALNRPNRFLSFQGRLTNQYGNPITAATNVVFKLYDDPSTGATLWNSGTCLVSPDTDGVFSTLLGSACGTELASSVFSDNAAVWLGVQVAADIEATPRIQIATVAYALNSETLQGYTASSSATVNTVPVINNSGQIVLAVSSPKIQSTAGTFAIEGQVLTIQTPSSSNGSITVAPDGTGSANLNFSGAAPGAGGFVNATNANITSKSLYYGSVASNATGYNLLQLQAGSTPANRFTVDAVGNATASGTINGLAVSNGTISTGTWNGSLVSALYGGTGANNSTAAQYSVPYYSTTGVMGGVLAPGTDGYVLTTHNTGGVPTWTDVSSVGTNYWALGAGTIYPGNTTMDLLLGASATASAKFAFTGVNSGTPTASISGNTNIATFIDGNGYISSTNRNNITLGNSSTHNTTGNVLINPNGFGNVGIGTTSPLSKLSIIAPSANSIGKAALLVDQYESQDIFTASASGTPKMTLANDGTLNLYNATSSISNASGDITITPAANLNVVGNATVSGNLTFYGGARSIQSTATQGLTIGGSTTGNITLNPLNAVSGGYVAPATTNVSNLGTASLLWKDVYATTLHQGTYLVCDSNGTNCPAAGVNYWDQASGVLYPKNNTVDLLIGYTATTSAKFAFKNVLTGTPTASIAGSVAGRATYLTGDGTLAMVNAADLTLGSSTTGRVILTSGATNTVIANGTLTTVAGDLNSSAATANLFTTGTTNLTIGTLATTLNMLGASGATMTLGNTGGVTAVNVNTGTGGTTYTTTNGIFTLNTGTGNISLGTDAAQKNITIGNQTGTSAVTIDSGTGAINIGAAIAKTITLGNATTTTALNLTSGTGAQTFTSSVATGTLLSGAFVFKDAALSSGDLIYATASAATSGDLLQIANSGTGAFSGNMINLDNNYYGGGTFTGNFLKFSKNGVNVFTLDNGANASMAGTLTFGGTATIQSTATNPLIIGGTTTGNITLNPLNAVSGGYVAPNTTNVSNLGTASLLWKDIYATTLHQGTYLVCDSNGTNCPAAVTTYWDQAAGVLYPKNNTVDLLIGSTATTSAKFAFTGVKTGTPTASISGATNVATFIDGNGNISMTNRKDLTLGNSATYNTTGNILLNPNGTGNVGIGTTAPNVNFQVGAGTSSHSLTTNDTLFTADVEVDGNLYLDGGIIANSLGTVTVSFPADPTAINSYNTLGNGSWLVTNTANPGIAALMVNQGQGGDIFTASASGSTKMTLTNAGNLGIGTASPTSLLHLNNTISPVYDTTSSSSTSVNASTLSWSHVTSTCSNRIIIVGVGTRSNTAVNSITYNSVNLTKIRSDAPGSDVRGELWYLVNPTSGSNTVAITLAGSTSITAGATTLCGVDQITPYSNQNGATGTSTTPSVNVTSATGELVVDIVTSQAIRSFTAGAGQTERWDTSSSASGGAGSTEAGAASVTMDWTMTSESWAIEAASFKPQQSIFAVSDFGVNKMTVLNNGNVGIGTTAPGRLLEVVGGAAGVETILAQLRSSYADVNTGTTLRFTNNTSAAGAGGVGEISVKRTGTYGSQMVLRTATDGGGQTDRLTIDNAGNVGIGTTAPAQKLTILGSANQVFIANTDFVSGSVGSGLYLGTPSNSGNVNSQIQAFNTGNTLTASLLLNPFGGNVGIGTGSTAPAKQLDVLGSGTTASTEYMLGAFDQVTSLGGAYLGYYVGSGGTVQEGRIRSGGSIPLALGTTSQQQAIYILNTNGNIGMGTTAPASKLALTSTGTFAAAGISGLDVSAHTVTLSGANPTTYATFYANSLGAMTLVGTNASQTVTTASTLYIANPAAGANVTITNNRPINTASGAYLTSGGVWTGAPSYRRYKDNFTSTSNYLDKLANMDLYEWQYRNEVVDGVNRYLNDPQRHASPFLDDFYTVFGLSDDQGVNMQDLAGVALASVKELNTRFENFKTSEISKDLAMTNTGDLNITATDSGNYVLTDTASNTVIDKIGAFGQIVAANIKTGAIETQQLIADRLQTTAATIGQLTTDSLQAVKTIVGSLLAENIQTKLISPLPGNTDVTVQIGSATESGKLAIVNGQGTEVASIDDSGNARLAGDLQARQATFSGTLYADAIKSQSLDDIKNVLTQVQTDQNLLKDAANWNVLTATDSASLLIANSLQTTDLYVTNQAAVNSLSVTNTMTIGTDLVFGSASQIENGKLKIENSLNSLSAPLRIQSLAMAPLEIMAGLVTIDTHGNVNIAGDLYVAGRITSSGLTLKTNQESGIMNQGSATNSANLLTLQNGNGSEVASVNSSGSAQFSTLSTPELIIAGADATVSGTIINGVITTNSTVGQATISAGVSEITIRNPKVTDYTLVYVTPTSSTQNNVLYVKSKQAGQFVVGFANPINIDVSFNWWIVKVIQ